MSKVLRFCQAGHRYPPRLDRTNRALPMGAPWQQTGTHGFLATQRNPPGFLGKGVVIIRRPCLTAWPVANPTPASVVHPLKRRSNEAI